MKMNKPLAFTLFTGLLLWTVITWPLPAKFSSVIPLSERRSVDAPRIVFNQSGDQFQLLYHFWLARDVIAGKTPPFANVYEFNFRGDTDRREFSTYYIPFSLIYAAVSPFFGHAAGWNAVIFASLFIGLLGTFALARRLSGSDWIAAFVAIATAAFPYRWHTLLTGSPTGYAICLVPWLAYGVDRLVRDASAAGSVIAGTALFSAFCSDLHVFYFSVLATPLFALSSLLLAWRGGIRLSRACIAAIPFLALAAAAAIFSKIASSALGASAIRHGRTFEEIGLFSPVMRGLFTTQFLVGTTNTLYIGIFAGIFFPLALLRFLATPACRRDTGRLAAVLLLAAAAIGAILLAAGANGPFQGLPIRIVRRFVPKYDLIRQTAKIFCLMPTILAAFSSLAFADIADTEHDGAAPLPKRVKRPLPFMLLILGAAMLLQQVLWFRVPLNVLSKRFPAYRATREAADASGIANPKAVAIPIWPGDSHFASIYELGIMESRLRLVNGYSPSPPADYFDSVFKPLESINQGFLDYNQCALLKQMSVDFLIFHEDAFPDKVSPFPAGLSLATLWCNPRLEPLFQGTRVSAFKLKESGTADGDKVPMPPFRSFLNYASALVWHPRQVARSLETASAPGRINLALRAPVFMHPGMRYMILDHLTGWHSIPLYNPMGGEYALPEGVTDPELIILAAGNEDIGDGTITPALMFHEGTSSIANGAALISADGNEKHSVVLEGPFVPIGAGHWRAKAEVKGACANGAILEVVRGVRGETEVVASSEFAAVEGQDADTATVEFDWGATDPPFALRVSSRRVAPLEVRALRLIGIP